MERELYSSDLNCSTFLPNFSAPPRLCAIRIPLPLKCQFAYIYHDFATITFGLFNPRYNRRSHKEKMLKQVKGNVALKERKIKCIKERGVGVNFSMPLSLLDPLSNLNYQNISALSSNYHPN
jgi:hypothetical protein